MSTGLSAGLAIVGYGKMGRLVEQLAPEYGFTVRAKFNFANIATLSTQSLEGARVAIEFSTPAAAPANLANLAALGVNTVCGTTGWLAQLSEVRAAVASANTALLYGCLLYTSTRSSATRIRVGYSQNEIGFGWTNGVFCELLAQLEERRR